MRHAIAVIALVFSVAGIAAAQTPAVAVATRVRVTAPKAGMDRQVGTVARSWPDSIAVSTDSGVRTVALRASLGASPQGGITFNVVRAF